MYNIFNYHFVNLTRFHFLCTQKEYRPTGIFFLVFFCLFKLPEGYKKTSCQFFHDSISNSSPYCKDSDDHVCSCSTPAEEKKGMRVIF